MRDKFLIDAGDALYSGIVEGNWNAAFNMLGNIAAGFVPVGNSLIGNIMGNFAKAGIKEAFSIIGEAASNGWDFKKIRLGEHLKGVAISGAVSSFNAWAGAKLGINYQKPGLGDALKMTAVNFGSRTLSFALNEGFKAIEQGTDYRFDWNRAARQLGANAGLSVVETGVQVGMSHWNSAMAETETKSFFAKMGLRTADMLVNGASTYITGFVENVAAAWVEKGNELTINDVAQSSGMAMRQAYQAMGETDREQVYLGIRGLIKKGIRLAGKALRWLGNKLWQGVKAAGRWAQDAVKNTWKHVRELPGALAAHFTHVERENRREREGERKTEGKGEGPEAKAGEGTYTVKKGDTFWKIAKKKLREKLGREPTDAEVSRYARQLEMANGKGQFELRPGEKIKIVEPPVKEEGGRKFIAYDEGTARQLDERARQDDAEFSARRAGARRKGAGREEKAEDDIQVGPNRRELIKHIANADYFKRGKQGLKDLLNPSGVSNSGGNPGAVLVNPTGVVHGVDSTFGNNSPVGPEMVGTLPGYSAAQTEFRIERSGKEAGVEDIAGWVLNQSVKDAEVGSMPPALDEEGEEQFKQIVGGLDGDFNEDGYYLLLHNFLNRVYGDILETYPEEKYKEMGAYIKNTDIYPVQSPEDIQQVIEEKFEGDPGLLKRTVRHKIGYVYSELLGE